MRLHMRGVVFASGALAVALLPLPAGADPLLAHRATYLLGLDASKPSVKLDSASGRIDYEISGDACSGYNVKLHQGTEVDTGEGSRVSSDMASTSWEDGEGKSYRFNTVTRSSDQPVSDVDAVVTRKDGGLSVQVKKPVADTVEIKGDILLPTQHVVRVLEAAAKGEPLIEARVFDGSDDGDKIYDTLAVIGRPAKGEETLPEAARSVLSGVARYPVTISYFDTEKTAEKPAYVMSMSLYANGVIGEMKIDYSDFVLKGRLDTFEALKASDGCKK